MTAELKKKPAPARFEFKPGDGFDAMGKPIPAYRRQAGYNTCKGFGCTSEAAWSAVHGMAGALEKDRPYEAMAAATLYVDLTGAYVLMAVLLTAPKPRIRVLAGSAAP